TVDVDQIGWEAAAHAQVDVEGDGSGRCAVADPEFLSQIAIRCPKKERAVHGRELPGVRGRRGAAADLDGPGEGSVGLPQLVASSALGSGEVDHAARAGKEGWIRALIGAQVPDQARSRDRSIALPEFVTTTTLKRPKIQNAVDGGQIARIGAG